MEEVAEYVGMNYPDTPEPRYVAHSDYHFLFSWEDEASVENPINIEEDDGFSQPRNLVTEPSSQPLAMDTRPASRSIENLQKIEISAARQLFDL